MSQTRVAPAGARDAHAVCRLGDRGAAVFDLRVALTSTGDAEAAGARPDQSIDPLVFDLPVQQAVRAFQQRRGLVADGVVGPETARALAAARWRLGDRILAHTPGHLLHGDDVADLQSRLLGLGLGPDRVDAVFGPRTEAAVRDFQRGIGLPGDGIVGPDTLRGLAGLRRAVRGGNPHALRERETLRRAGRSLVGRTILLDPGHGGPDLGCVANGVVEADLVLDLARRVEGRLLAQGVDVLFSRIHGDGGDETVRSALANDLAADLVISLHCDAAAQAQASGIATYYYGTDRFGAWSVVGEHLADLIQRELVARTGMIDCRSHARSWTLLQRTEMPAVRVEVGHVSNPTDAARLSDPALRDVMAEAIVVAIQRLYLGDEDSVRTGVFRLAELRSFMADLAG